jgi:uncharacterized membrane protein YfcA
MDLLPTIYAFAIGIVAGFFGSTVGGGGLLSIPCLMLVGLPPQIAIATDRFGGIGQAVAALFKYWKAEKIVWRYVPILATLSLGGSVVGANSLLTVDPTTLRKAAGILLPILVVFIVFRKEVGLVRRNVSRMSIALGSLFYFIVQSFAGFFGAGTGPLVFFTLVVGYGLTIVEAVATQIIPLLVLSFSSIAVFAIHELIDYAIGAVLMIGMAIGGFLGAHMALKKESAWLKGLFVVLVIGASTELLFF